MAIQDKDTPTLNSLDKCPHCGVSSPYLPLQWFGKTVGTKFHLERNWGVFCCNSCGGLITAASSNLGSSRNLTDWLDVVFPAPATASGDIPVTARNFLQQAMDTIHAPDAAAVMAGSAVDAMLKAKNLFEGSLYSRIDQARDQGILTQGMADWAHQVRLGSNRPRHADSENPHVSLDEAKQSVDFAEALGNFLFVLTAKIERGLAAAMAVEE